MSQSSRFARQTYFSLQRLVKVDGTIGGFAHQRYLQGSLERFSMLKTINISLEQILCLQYYIKTIFSAFGSHTLFTHTVHAHC